MQVAVKKDLVHIGISSTSGFGGFLRVGQMQTRRNEILDWKPSSVFQPVHSHQVRKFVRWCDGRPRHWMEVEVKKFLMVLVSFGIFGYCCCLGCFCYVLSPKHTLYTIAFLSKSWCSGKSIPMHMKETTTSS